jgi:hypothetical protein
MEAEAIWCGKAGYSYIAQKIALAAPPSVAWIQGAASGPFEFYVNGELAGRGLGPTLVGRPMWERFDIAKLLTAGENTLIALVSGGDDKPFFVASGEIEYTDGRRLELSTGVPWQVLRADAWDAPSQADDPEIYRAAEDSVEGQWRDADPVILTPEERPGSWQPAATVEREAAAEIIALGEGDADGPIQALDEFSLFSRCKCVRSEAMLTPGRAHTLIQTRDPQRGVYLLLDFGRIMRGYPRVRLRGYTGAVVDLGFGTKPGRIDSRLRYVCRDERQEWDGIRPLSCRYVWVRLANCPEPLELDCVSLIERRVEISALGSLQVSRELDALRRTAAKALEAVRQEVHVLSLADSCPPFDPLRVYALALEEYSLSGDGRLAAAWLQAAPSDAGRWDWCRVLMWENQLMYCGVDDTAAALAVVDELLAAAEPDGSAVDRVLEAAALDAAGRLCRAIGDNKRAGLAESRYPQACKAALADLRGGEDATLATALALFFGLADEKGTTELVAALPLRAPDFLEAFFGVGGLWRAGLGTKAIAYIQRHWGRIRQRPGTTWTEKAGGRVLDVSPGPAYVLGTWLLGISPVSLGAKQIMVAPDCDSVDQGEGALSLGGVEVRVKWLKREGYFSIEVEAKGEGEDEEEAGDTEIELHVSVPRLGQRFPTLDLNGETCWRNEKVHPNEHVRQVMATPQAVILVLPGGGPYRIEMG